MISQEIYNRIFDNHELIRVENGTTCETLFFVKTERSLFSFLEGGDTQLIFCKAKHIQEISKEDIVVYGKAEFERMYENNQIQML